MDLSLSKVLTVLCHSILCLFIIVCIKYLIYCTMLGRYIFIGMYINKAEIEGLITR